jgi:hypothetical protein
MSDTELNFERASELKPNYVSRGSTRPLTAAQLAIARNPSDPWLSTFAVSREADRLEKARERRRQKALAALAA